MTWVCVATSCFGGAALEREEPARAFLDEQNDQHEDSDLRQYRARIGLEELVGNAEGEGADERAPQIANAAKHHDHERIDDVALAEIGADIVNLRKRDAGEARNPGAQPEGECVDAARAKSQ